MSDPSRREATLARLFAVLQGIEDFASASRNALSIPAGKRPWVNLSDGIEQSLAPSEGTILSNMAPLILSMQPIVSILIGDVPGTIGTELNLLIAKVQKAVLSDAQLVEITGAAGGTRGNGRLVYLAMRPFLGQSLAIDCDAEIEFGIYTRFDPNTL